MPWQHAAHGWSRSAAPRFRGCGGNERARARPCHIGWMASQQNASSRRRILPANAVPSRATQNRFAPIRADPSRVVQDRSAPRRPAQQGPVTRIDPGIPLLRYAYCDGSVRPGSELPRDLEPGWFLNLAPEGSGDLAPDCPREYPGVLPPAAHILLQTARVARLAVAAQAVQDAEPALRAHALALAGRNPQLPGSCRAVKLLQLFL